MENLSPKINIAQIELNNGIKCKNIPALFAPIIETPLFQKIKEKIPANIAT